MPTFLGTHCLQYRIAAAVILWVWTLSTLQREDIAWNSAVFYFRVLRRSSGNPEVRGGEAEV